MNAATLVTTYAASHTPMAGQQVIIDFAQVGTAGPFPVVNGHVKLPDATMQDLARMLRPTYEAEQQAAPKAAPGVGNSGFDHKTAADFLNGKTVSDEAVRTFVAASRWAHDERAALGATLLAVHGVLASREAEIALLKKALLEAEAAPQQEAQEPVATLHCNDIGYVWARATEVGKRMRFEQPINLYTAPQPAPAPAIGDELRDTLVAVSAAIAEQDDRAAQKMIREILAATPTPTAEQQARTRVCPRR